MLLVVTVRLFAKAQSYSTHHPTRPRLFFPARRAVRVQGEEMKDSIPIAAILLNQYAVRYLTCAENQVDSLPLLKDLCQLLRAPNFRRSRPLPAQGRTALFLKRRRANLWAYFRHRFR